MLKNNIDIFKRNIDFMYFFLPSREYIYRLTNGDITRLYTTYNILFTDGYSEHLVGFLAHLD